jgi:hypothetical protein
MGSAGGRCLCSMVIVTRVGIVGYIYLRNRREGMNCTIAAEPGSRGWIRSHSKNRGKE